MDQINNNSSGLSDTQEILLMAFSEGQLGWWGSLRARALMRTSKAAIDYVDSLKAVAHEAAAWEKSSSFKIQSGHNLVDNVFKRIEQEERSAVFLGKRQESFSLGEIFSNLNWGRTLAAVSVTAAIVLGVAQVFQGSANPGTSANVALQSNPSNAENIETVSLASDQDPEGISKVHKKYVQPKIIDRNYATAMEVDWMRSNTGHVRVLHDEPGSAPIIWVRKRR